ncbi:MAG: redoxin domain-containing protein [Marinilabiliales bacterium]|nr:redoxin domain-containing protein [Marinilabiliales bacterium]
MILDMQDRMEILKKDKKRVKELLSFLDSQTIYNKRIAESKSKDLTEFIKKVDTSMVAILASFYLNPDFDYDIMAKINTKFATICPRIVNISKIQRKVEKIIPVTAGYPASDFTMPDIYKKDVSLTDFKGKPVLLYFWASTANIAVRKTKELTMYSKNTGTKALKSLQFHLILTITFGKVQLAMTKLPIGHIYRTSLVGKMK